MIKHYTKTHDRIKLKTQMLGLVMILVGLSLNAQVQMPTSVSIGPGAASTSQYNNWYSFWRSLQGLSRTDGGPLMLAGISNPVVVDVAADLTETTSNVQFPAITGMSATNTITINGNNKFLAWSGTDGVISFTGGDYFTIKNLTIRNTTSLTTILGVRFSNSSDYNTLDGCTIEFTNLLTGSTTGGAYIAFSNTTTVGSTTSVNNGSYNTINACKMRTTLANSSGPGYGIVNQGNSSTYSGSAGITNNTFTNNVISNFYQYGIYSNYCNGNQVISNDISRSDASSGSAHSSTMSVIYFNYCYGTGRANKANNNNIHDLPYTGAPITATNLSGAFNGIYFNYSYGTAVLPQEMNGNTLTKLVFNNSVYLLAGYYAEYLDANANNINTTYNNTTSTTAHYNFYLYYCLGIECSKNSVTNCNSKYYMYNYYIYYTQSGTGAFTWTNVEDNVSNGNTAVNYMYNYYFYYYRTVNNMRFNRNIAVGNKVTGATSYFMNYVYYGTNMQITNNLIAGNTANSQYWYLYSALSGGYTAEVRNNTFYADMSACPTPASSYLYAYQYFSNYTLRSTGNVLDVVGPTGTANYYRYVYFQWSTLAEFDYNVYRFNNNYTYPYLYVNGVNVVDLANFQSNGFNGPNDIFPTNIDYVDPANNDYRLKSWIYQNNVPFKPTTVKDVKSIDRNLVRHDRGGIENYTDLELTSSTLNIPSIICSGHETGPFNVEIKNLYQYDKASGFRIAYSVNGGAKTSMPISTPIDINASATITIPSIRIDKTGTVRLALFLDMPDDNGSNDSIIFNTFVKPAPGGSFYTFGTQPTVAFYQYGKGNDVTVLGAPVYYNVNSPRMYSNSTYGTDWTASTFAITEGGNFRPASETKVFSVPGSNDLVVEFKTTDATMEDSTIWMVTKITDLNNGCDTFVRRKILLYPTIVPDFTYPSKICHTDKVLFYNTSTVRSGSMEFLWDFGTGKLSDQSKETNPVFVFPAPGSYKVKMIGKTLPYGFPSYDSVIVVVTDIPKVNFVVKNACQGETVGFINSTTPASNYAWKFGDNKTSTQTSPNHLYANPGSYSVSLTATLNGCSITKTANAYVFDKPQAGFVKTAGTCSNLPFQFKNTSTIPNGNLGFTWDFNDNGSISTESDPAVRFTVGGTKRVKLSAISEFGCKDSFIQNIQVKQAPEVSFTTGEACSRKPSAFTNTTPVVSGTNASFSWDFGDGGTATVENPNHNWIGLGSKTVSLNIILDNGCTGSFSKNVNVGIQAQANFDAVAVCAGKPMQFDNLTNTPVNTTKYEWEFGDGSPSNTSFLPTHIYTTNSTRSYNVTLKASIDGGCADQITKAVQVYENPNTCDYDYKIDYVRGFYGVTFSPKNDKGFLGKQNNVEYTWVYGNEGSGTDTFHNFLKDGRYTVTMRARIAATGCECSASKTVIMDRAGLNKLAQGSIKVFPNPSVGLIHVTANSKIVEVRVIDAQGKQIQIFKGNNSNAISMNLNTVSAGVYYLKIQTQLGQTQESVIINP